MNGNELGMLICWSVAGVGVIAFAVIFMIYYRQQRKASKLRKELRRDISYPPDYSIRLTEKYPRMVFLTDETTGLERKVHPNDIAATIARLETGKAQ